MKLGVVTNAPDEVFQRDVIRGAQLVAGQYGYELDVIVVPNRQAASSAFQRLSGLLVISNVLPNTVLHELHFAGLPMSLVSHTIQDLPVPAVSPNNAQGIAILAEHLVEDCNRRQLVFIQGDLEQTDGIQRDAAFRQEVMRYNLHVPPEAFLRGDFIPGIAAESVKHLLDTHLPFDGILAADYLMGLAAVEVLRKAGFRVPEDVSVAGFGDGPEADAAGLTTVAADVVELGARATRQLIGQAQGLRIRGLTLLSATLMQRETSLISEGAGPAGPAGRRR
jgi:DNA-binding LacI/PurR family transcriptional regulator